MPDRVTRYRPVSGMQLRAGRYGQSSVMGWPPRVSPSALPSQITQRDIGMTHGATSCQSTIGTAGKKPRRGSRGPSSEATFAVREHQEHLLAIQPVGAVAAPFDRGLSVLKPRYDSCKRMPDLRDTSVEWIGLSAWRNLDAGHGTKQQV